MTDTATYKSDRPRIYVAGVISADPIGGVRDAVRAFHRLWSLGAAPFVPHLDILLQLHEPLPWSDWLEFDFRWIEVCDALYRIPGQAHASKGADLEEAYAAELGMPILRSDADVVAWIGHDKAFS